MNIKLGPMTPTQSRALAVALLLAVVLAVAGAIALPILRLHRHYDDAIAAAVDRITRERRLIGMAPALHDQLHQLHELNPAQYYLHDPSPALAAAEIQSAAKSQIDAGGCKLVSMNVAQPVEEAPLTRVTVSVQFTGPVECVKAVLYGLEGGKPYLFLDNVAIHSSAGFSAFTNKNNDGPAVLNTQFDLSGYVVRKLP